MVGWHTGFCSLLQNILEHKLYSSALTVPCRHFDHLPQPGQLGPLLRPDVQPQQLRLDDDIPHAAKCDVHSHLTHTWHPDFDIFLAKVKTLFSTV